MMETQIEIVKGINYNCPISDDIEVLFTEYKPKDQYWRRDENFPDYFYDYDPHVAEKLRCRINASKTQYKNGRLVSLSNEDTIELLKLVAREKRRMEDGVYIMNNGKKIYFPGFYYGILQWVKMFGVSGDGYGEHRKYQRVLSYVRDLAIKDDDMFGYYCHKAKKTGITQFVAAANLIECMVNKQFIVTAMSKVHETAKKANFKYFLYGLKNLPPVLRPYIENTKWQKSVQSIDFKDSNPEQSLDNTYAAVPTTMDGLDGFPIIKRIHIDEPPKFPKAVPIEQVFEKSKEQVKQQHVKHGIIEMTSYPPEEDTEAFYWCRTFYNEMCRVTDGKPANGIIPFFIGVTESSAGTFDKYGEPNVTLAYSQELAARSKCKNSYEKQARKRQYPITEKEGWESGGDGSVFDNITLGGLRDGLEERYSHGDLNYIECNMEWTDGFLSPVRLVPVTLEEKLKDKIGLWKIYCDLKYLEGKTNLCFENKRKIHYKGGVRHYLLQPPEYTDFVGATDPVDYAKISETTGKISKTASIVRNLSGDLISVYNHREENPDHDIENICMEMIFFNKYNLIEGNRRTAYTTINNLGLQFFNLVFHPNGEILPFSEKVNIKPVNSSSNIISRYVSLIIKRYKTTPEYIKSVPVLEQLMDFDSSNTEKYDMAVTYGLSEIALESLLTWLRTKKNKEGKYSALGSVMSGIL